MINEEQLAAWGLAVNFVGAPALTRSGMRGYRQTTVVGMQFIVSLPVGQYYPERLINLGHIAGRG